MSIDRNRLMFTGTVVTDEQGKPKVDSQSGAVVIEDGVCWGPRPAGTVPVPQLADQLPTKIP